jgi:hypothetical protein
MTNSPSQTPDPQNQGEGNIEAGRRFNKAETEFAKSGKVSEAAKDARRAIESPENDELEKAKAEGLSHKKEESQKAGPAASLGLIKRF